MFPRIKQVEAIVDFRLRLTFTDGFTGEVNLRDWITGRGGIFSALEDPAFFRQAAVHKDFGTVHWPNDVDFDPDVLYSMATGQPIPAEPPTKVAG